MLCNSLDATWHEPCCCAWLRCCGRAQYLSRLPCCTPQVLATGPPCSSCGTTSGAATTRACACARRCPSPCTTSGEGRGGQIAACSVAAAWGAVCSEPNAAETNARRDPTHLPALAPPPAARPDLHPHTGEQRNYTVALYLPYLFQASAGRLEHIGRRACAATHRAQSGSAPPSSRCSCNHPCQPRSAWACAPPHLPCTCLHPLHGRRKARRRPPPTTQRCGCTTTPRPTCLCACLT